MKMKEQTKELESLIKESQNVNNYVSSALQDIGVPEELQDPEPIFSVDYDAEMKKYNKKARASVKQLIKAIVPAVYMNEDYIVDKISQDSESLGKLYYQQHLIELVQRANVDSIARGNVSPRMIEVFNMTSKSHSDIDAQINLLQTALRKSYIDIILDLKHKAEEERSALNYQQTEKKLESDKPFNKIFVGSKELVEEIQNKKRKIIENKTQDTSLT